MSNQIRPRLDKITVQPALSGLNACLKADHFDGFLVPEEKNAILELVEQIEKVYKLSLARDLIERGLI